MKLNSSIAISYLEYKMAWFDILGRALGWSSGNVYYPAEGDYDSNLKLQFGLKLRSSSPIPILDSKMAYYDILGQALERTFSNVPELPNPLPFWGRLQLYSNRPI